MLIFWINNSKFFIMHFMVILNVFSIIIAISISDLLLLKIYYNCRKYVIPNGLYEWRFFIYISIELQIN